MKSILLLDGPESTSDKRWLIRELSNNDFQVHVIDLRKKISEIIIERKAFFRLRMYIAVFRQARYANKKATEGEVVFVWKPLSAVVLNLLKKIYRKKYTIVSFGWLNPNKDIYFKLNKLAFNDIDFMPVVNLRENINRYKNFYGLKDTSRFLFMPDVFDDSSEFVPDNQKAFESDYFFSGGIANRDFETIINVARELREIKFVIVCDRERLTGIEIPENIEVRNNIPKEEYYRLMSNAKASIILLKKDKASGLINICKSIQQGVICISSKTESAGMYFSDENNRFLISIGDGMMLQERIKEICGMSRKQYLNVVREMQKTIENGFSPNMCVKNLLTQMERSRQ